MIVLLRAVLIILLLIAQKSSASPLAVKFFGVLEPAPRDARLSYRIDGGTSSECGRPAAPAGVLCEAAALPGVHNYELFISAPNFKRYSRTAAQVAVDTSDVKVDFGQLKLVPLDLTVVRILRKNSKDGGAEFELNLSQAAARDVNIVEIVVSSRFIKYATCASLTSPQAVFTIKDTFTITSGMLSGLAVNENESGSQYRYPVEGRITARQCPATTRYLTLSLKTAIAIRGKDSVLAVRLPPTFKIGLVSRKCHVT